MQAFYGSYSHDVNEVTCQARETIERSTYGQPMKLIRLVTLTGRKIGASSSINTQMRALRKAYSVDAKDFVFKDDNGVELWYTMRNSDTWNGIQVIDPPHVPNAQGADLATKCDYTVTLKGETLLAPMSQLFDFTQSIEGEGGGPLRVMLTPARGRSIEQTVLQQRPFFARQVGSASSFSPSAQVPGPKWPAQRVDNRWPRVTQYWDGSSSQFRYRYEWAYDFQSPTGF
jgi:hypothetical protein